MGQRHARDLGTAELPAGLRPCRACDPEAVARRTGAGRGRDAPAFRVARSRGTRRLDRGSDSRALAPEGRPRAAATATRVAHRRRAARAARARRRRAAVLRAAGHRARRRPGTTGARLPLRQSRVGPAATGAAVRLQAPDRVLQTRARAGVRLLRPPVTRRRSLPRACRPEGRPRRGRAAHSPLHPGAEGRAATSTRSSRRRPRAWPASSASNASSEPKARARADACPARPCPGDSPRAMSHRDMSWGQSPGHVSFGQPSTRLGGQGLPG